jgi:hypothetical protein
MYSLYLNAKPWQAFSEMHQFFFWRSGTMSVPLTNLQALIENIERGVLILFYQSYLPPSNIASADNVAPFGQPGISFLIALSMLFGLTTMVHTKSMADRLLLCAMMVLAIFIFFLLFFDTRYMMVTLPILYLIAGVGTQQFMKVMLKNVQNRIFIFLFIGILLYGLGYVVYKNYNYYFQEYAARDGYLGRFYGRVQAGNYVAKNYEPKDTFIILGDKLTVPEDIFTFATYPKSFEYKFWEDIKNSYKDFEDEVFKRKEKMVFIFSNGHDFLEMPGFRYGEPVSWDEFENLYPYIPPSHTISSARGWPVISVFELHKADANARIAPLLKNANDLDLKIAGLKLSGGIKKYDLKINGSDQKLHLDILPSMEVLFLPNKTGKLKFAPYFKDANYTRDIFEQKNIILSKEDSRYLELSSSGEGYVVYKIESPTKMMSLDIETHPRLYNDVAKLNSITALYSYDGIAYSVLYKAKSNGSDKWDLHFYRDTFHTIHPNAKVVYIKFILKGKQGQSQLWSPPPVEPIGKHYTMKFVAKIEPLDLDWTVLNREDNQIKPAE